MKDVYISFVTIAHMFNVNGNVLWSYTKSKGIPAIKDNRGIGHVLTRDFDLNEFVAYRRTLLAKVIKKDPSQKPMFFRNMDMLASEISTKMDSLRQYDYTPSGRIIKYTYFKDFTTEVGLYDHTDRTYREIGWYASLADAKVAVAEERIP